ncbi:MAG: LysM peptidoglycan-binding domain-containing protein [Anaerolineae bacterium]|nr:LysM peptidoglycan-binding domain-containing protein [Anaerolineae bacterium]
MPRLRRVIPVVIGSALILSSVTAAFAQDENYTVTTGDSLDKIGAIYDVQVACLAETNNIATGALLEPGQVVAISFDCPLYDGVDFVTTPREVNTNVTEGLGQGGGGGAADVTYQVQRRDTLDTIGQTLNVSVVAIQVANELKAGAILQPGQQLIIPADAPAYGQFPALTTPDDPDSDESALGQGGGGATDLSGGDTTYVVQQNDTLDTIGALFDVQTACLASENNLADPAKIYPGQSIAVKVSCPRYDGFDFVINPRGE